MAVLWHRETIQTPMSWKFIHQLPPRAAAREDYGSIATVYADERIVYTAQRGGRYPVACLTPT